MKILVLGGAGMLGHKIYQTLADEGKDVTCTLHGSKNQQHHQGFPLLQSPRVIEDVDAMQFLDLCATLVEVRPDVIVNCIGIIKQRGCAKAAIPSITVNSLLPHKLAEWSQDWGGRVIHFSTDCVFSGKRGAYTENDLSDAEDLYGKSKFLGEVQGPNALTLRTSIVGRELSQYQSLLEWFLHQEGKAVSGYTQAIYSGVTTNYLANVVSWIIDDHPNLSGLYQVASSPISKFELLSKFKSAYKLDIDIEPMVGEICDRSMLSDKFHDATGYICPSWDELIEQVVSDATIYAAGSPNR
jgi:dTDP-4-dehydrorhamnose reductase